MRRDERSSSNAETLPTLTPGRLALLAMGFSVWTGLLEEIPVFIAPVGRVVVRLSRDFLWMTPLSDALFFLLVALGLLGVGRYWPRAMSRPVVMGVFAGLSTLALGLVLERIHPGAVLILAVGVGTQVGRKTRPVPARRPVVPAVVAVGLATVLGLTVRSEWKEAASKRQEVALWPAPPAEAPNILLLILDTVRGISLDFLDDIGPASEWAPVHAPALSELAGRSTVFTRAFVPSPWTLPSHASMFTGRWPNQLSGGRELSMKWMGTLGPGYPTVAEALTRAGYSTGGFVGNLVFAASETGLSRGFQTYRDYQISFGQVVLSSAMGRTLSELTFWRRALRFHDTLNRKDARAVTNEFLKWQSRQTERPFFAFLNYFDAHEPFFPPDSVRGAMPEGTRWDEFSQFVGLLTGATSWRTDKWAMEAPERVAHAMGYHDAILQMDREIQRLLNELEDRGVLENTVLIIASDHGEQLGEHGLYNHNNSLFLPLLNVPLIIHDPRPESTAGRVRDVVSLRNMAATIVDFAGLKEGSTRIAGTSLTRYWTPLDLEAGEAPALPQDTAFALLARGAVDEPWYPVVWGPAMYSLVDSVHHYILNGDGTEELYDLQQDPSETLNLSRLEASTPTLRRFRATLAGLAPNLPSMGEGVPPHPRAPGFGGGSRTPLP